MSQKIYQSMAKILASVGSVSKEKTSVGKFSFKYRSIDDVMNALHEAFADHGVFLIHDILDHKMIELVNERGEKRGMHHMARYRFTFFADDGSSIACEAMGECIENGDKGLGKTASYALKTALLQTFLIPTEDDSKDPDSTNKPAFEQKKPSPVQNQPVVNQPALQKAPDPLRNLRVDVYEMVKDFSKKVVLSEVFPNRDLIAEIKSGDEPSLLALKAQVKEFSETFEEMPK